MVERGLGPGGATSGAFAAAGAAFSAEPFRLLPVPPLGAVIEGEEPGRESDIGRCQCPSSESPESTPHPWALDA